MNFTIGTLVYSVEMIPGCLVISLEFTVTCAREKALLATVSFAYFNSIVLNSKLSKVVSCIKNNKSWDIIYVLFKLIPPCLWVTFTSDSNKAGKDKV